MNPHYTVEGLTDSKLVINLNLVFYSTYHACIHYTVAHKQLSFQALLTTWRPKSAVNTASSVD